MTQDNIQHLFILCYGRTGSTVVQGLLNRLDGYCIRGERKGVLSSLAKAAIMAQNEKDDFAPVDLKDGVKSPHYGVSETNPEYFGSTLAKLFTDEMLTPPPGTRVCGTKDITMSSEMLSQKDFQFVLRFVFERFQSPRVIFLTRNWEEVAQSGWWVKLGPEKVQAIVAESDARFAEACKMYPENTFHLDYSEFKHGVDGFRRLLNWLGEPIDEAMLADISSTKLTHMKTMAQTYDSHQQKLTQRVGSAVKRKAKRIFTSRDA